MKIVNTLNSSSALSQPSSAKNPSKEFKQMLDSPTYQYSGDEYYRLHQEDLQQSNLSFRSSNNIKQTSMDSSLKKGDETAFLKPLETEVAPPNTLVQIVQTNKPQPIAHTLPTQNSSIIFKASATPIEIQCIDKSIELRQITNPKQQLSETVKQDLKPIPGKKHQLFIEDDEAELSMNLNELTSDEQVTLIQLIKGHLKNQGLHINRLKINGVSQ